MSSSRSSSRSSRSSSRSSRSSGGGAQAGEFDASVWFRLVERDRWLLGMLADHRVLTTEQIAAVAFGSVRRAQDRLRKLRELGVVFAFRRAYQGGGTSPNYWMLGYGGARLIAAQSNEKPPTPSAHKLFLERLSASRTLPHLVGVNGFFCDLVAYARAHPDPADRLHARLLQWTPERLVGEQVLRDGPQTARPDGYGVWTEQGATVPFLLEYDTGTETINVLADKLTGYQQNQHAGRLPVLFSVHSTRRETALRAALPAAYDRAIADGLAHVHWDTERAGVPSRMPMVVTAPRDHGHPDGPAGPIWAPWYPPTAPPRRYPAPPGHIALPEPATPAAPRYRLAQLPPPAPPTRLTP